MQKFSPSLVDAYLLHGDTGVSGQISDSPDNRVDNLDGPTDLRTYRSRGRFGDITKSDDWYTRVGEMHPAVGLAILGGVALGLTALAAALSPPGRRALGTAADAASRGARHAWDSATDALDHGARDARHWASRRADSLGHRASLAADRARRMASNLV